MAKRKDLGAIAPPPRKPRAVPATETVKATEQVPVNVRISSDRATYLRMLSAKTGTKQYQLVERALDLLREKEGEI